MKVLVVLLGLFAMVETHSYELAPPPSDDSDVTAQEMAQIKELIRGRDAEDCKRIRTERAYSLKGFFGPPYGPLTVEEVSEHSKLFDQLTRCQAPVSVKYKSLYPRKRPFQKDEMISSCIGRNKRTTPDSYPSGHAILATFSALVMGDVLPQHASHLITRAAQIRTDRMLDGMHHLSDVEAGKEIGQELYEKFKLGEFCSDPGMSILEFTKDSDEEDLSAEGF